MGKGSIFLVEDEPVLAQHLQEFLSLENFSVVGMADSAEEALPRVVEKSPDLLLLDINLKDGSNGIELAEAIQKYLDIPVIFLTERTDKATLESVKRVNPYGLLLKPFDELQLRIVLELAIAKHQQEKVRNAHLATEDFFHYLSHGFRSAVARILGLTNLFKYEVHNEKALHLNLLVEKNALKIDELLINYFHYIKTIDYKDLKFETVPWEGLVQEVVEELHYKELNALQLPSLSVVVGEGFISDLFLVRVILTQILKNALEYKKEIAEVKIRIIEQENHFQLRILDKGIGMNELSRSRCFNLYFRGTEKSEGIGIGLNLARKAVEKLNGKIEILSVEEKGTYVSVLLPKILQGLQGMNHQIR